MNKKIPYLEVFLFIRGAPYGPENTVFNLWYVVIELEHIVKASRASIVKAIFNKLSSIKFIRT